MITQYFHCLFQKQGEPNTNELLQYLPSMVIEEENNKLNGNFTMGETKEALQSIVRFKAPGPDGYHAIFYKQIWNELQHEVHSIFQNFHQHRYFC